MALTNSQLQKRLQSTRRPKPNAGELSNPSYVGNIGFGGFEDAGQNGPTTAGLYAQSSTSTDKTNPANIAADIMKGDSRLMQAAETRGLQSANKRGLINSSMAVGAAQDAVLDEVIPLASQEAQQRFQDNTDQRNFGFDSILSRQEYEQTGGLAGQNFGFEERLQRNQLDSAEEQAALDRDFELMFQDREIGARFTLADMDADIRRELMQMESDMRSNILRTEQSLQAKNISTEAFLTARDQYNQRVTNIMNNPDMSAEEKRDAIASEQDNLYVDVQLIEDMYSIDLPWTTDYAPTQDPVMTAQDARAQVNRFFVDILGRDAEPAALNFYEKQIVSGNMTPSQVRSEIMGSNESTSNPKTSTANYSFDREIREAYRNTFNRNPDLAGQQYWANQLRSGNITVSEMQRLLAQSDEATGKARFDPQTRTLVPVTQSGSSSSPASNAGSAVDQAYQSILGRAADKAGRDFWAGQIESGNATIEDVKSALRNSPEGKGTMKYNPKTQKLEPV